MGTVRADEAPDELLMDRYARGDGEAFEALFARYQGRAYGFFLRRTGSEDRAADLYQELFLRLHRARDSYDPARPFAPWFFQIARRILIDELRRAGRSLEVPNFDDDARTCLREPSVEGRLADAERADAILDELAEVERFVLVSAKVHGREYPEIATELGKSVAAVKKLASRAMRRLRDAHRAAGSAVVTS